MRAAVHHLDRTRRKDLVVIVSNTRAREITKLYTARARALRSRILLIAYRARDFARGMERREGKISECSLAQAATTTCMCTIWDSEIPREPRTYV